MIDVLKLDPNAPLPDLTEEFTELEPDTAEPAKLILPEWCNQKG